MDIYTLPEYLDIKGSHEVQLFDYKSSNDLARSKINLTQNTFSFLQEGTKEVVTQKSPISIDASNFLIMKSGHCLMTEKLSPVNLVYRSVLMFYSDDILTNFIRKHGIDATRNPHANPVHSIAYDDFMRSFVRSLEDVDKLPTAIQGKLLGVKFEEIMLYLIETQGTDFLQFLTATTDNQTRNFINVVEGNALNKLTLKELAFLSNMSVSTFKREFEKHFQESPIRWFQNKRLEQSAFLLKDKSKRPSDVYEEVGYESLSNFIQAFKARFGQTPKQYQLLQD